MNIEKDSFWLSQVLMIHIDGLRMQSKTKLVKKGEEDDLAFPVYLLYENLRKRLLHIRRY